MHEGVALASEAYDHFLVESGWLPEQVDKTFCHQVGIAHRKLLFERLGLNTQIDFSTVEYLGNTGSVALPMTAAIGIEQGHLKRDDRVALLGIGSGINVVMLAVQWQKSLVKISHAKQSPASLAAR
jgi:3-oxoacyl-[acyl-carrier-protein] synthase-3